MTLPRETEEAVLEWIKEHEFLYNRGHAQWKDTDKRKALWASKADEVGKTAKKLNMWFNTLRTKYGKLTKKKSGDGAKKPTDRDQWILTTLSYLDGHITRIPSRQSCSVSNVSCSYLSWEFVSSKKHC